jgi:hypothetical protein
MTSGTSTYELTPVERKHIEEENFLRLFPEYHDHLGTMLGTVVSCRHTNFHVSTVGLEEAREHLQSCQRCFRNFIIAKEQKARAY